ncbi:MAG: TetR/AcrR family transcriptional regulator [Termitinemataceae bacterium]
MTQQDILQAARIVWGNNFYKTMSLADVAQYLGVTKPALYRHFTNKDALLDALYVDFFDRYARYLQQALPSIFEGLDRKPLVALAGSMADYFIRDPYDFIFFLNLVLGQEKPGRTVKEELEKRGVPAKIWKDVGGALYVRLISATVLFAVARYHVRHCTSQGTENHKTATTPRPENRPGPLCESEEVRTTIKVVTDLVAYGFCDIDVVSRLPDLAHLDRRYAEHSAQPLATEGASACAAPMAPEATTARAENAARAASISAAVGASARSSAKALLCSVAQAIAAVGPWAASMKYVAQQAGLSKSGLYAHFASKEAMLRQLFITQFELLISQVKQILPLSREPLEQLYLLMRTVWEYLRSNQDILLVLDWVRLQRIDLGPLFPEGSLELFQFIRSLPRRLPLNDWDELAIIRWILFLEVNQLLVEFRRAPEEAVSLDTLHRLFLYITTGVEGCKECR